jgi:FMN phosphatase YigB (HAD superfamily)
MKFKTFLEQKSPKKTVYFDMDGVLADWEGMYKKHFGPKDPWTIPDSELWPNVISIKDFWTKLSLMKDSVKIWDYAQSHPNAEVKILSGYSTHDARSQKGKKAWLKNHSKDLKGKYDIHLVRAKDKKTYADENSVLIDDLIGNVEGFEKNGGTGILFKNAKQALKELKKFLDNA